MKKQKVEYKTEKIVVSMTLDMKLRIERSAKHLGINEPGLLRLLFTRYEKGKPLNPSDLISEVN